MLCEEKHSMGVLPVRAPGATTPPAGPTGGCGSPGATGAKRAGRYRASRTASWAALLCFSPSPLKSPAHRSKTTAAYPPPAVVLDRSDPGNFAVEMSAEPKNTKFRVRGICNAVRQDGNIGYGLWLDSRCAAFMAVEPTAKPTHELACQLSASCQ